MPSGVVDRAIRLADAVRAYECSKKKGGQIWKGSLQPVDINRQGSRSSDSRFIHEPGADFACPVSYEAVQGYLSNKLSTNDSKESQTSSGGLIPSFVSSPSLYFPVLTVYR